MPRYVNADKMIADTEAMRAVSEAITIDGIIKYINEYATSDVREVVRCKDCIHCIDKCEPWCEVGGFPHRLITDDDFCSEGERRW